MLEKVKSNGNFKEVFLAVGPNDAIDFKVDWCNAFKSIMMRRKTFYLVWDGYCDASY